MPIQVWNAGNNAFGSIGRFFKKILAVQQCSLALSCRTQDNLSRPLVIAMPQNTFLENWKRWAALFWVLTFMKERQRLLTGSSSFPYRSKLP